MKIKEYVDRLNAVEKFERSQPQPKNYKKICGTDVFGRSTEHQVRITYNKLPLGTGNLREHANPNFKEEHKIILAEKQRLGLSQTSINKNGTNVNSRPF